MIAMHRAGDAAPSSHHSAEGRGGTRGDEHFALMNPKAIMSDGRRQATMSNEAMSVATRRGRDDSRRDGRCRGAGSAATSLHGVDHQPLQI
jgi:hypothetical protein